jgi:hypothetical protein
MEYYIVEGPYRTEDTTHSSLPIPTRHNLLNVIPPPPPPPWTHQLQQHPPISNYCLNIPFGHQDALRNYQKNKNYHARYSMNFYQPWQKPLLPLPLNLPMHIQRYMYKPIGIPKNPPKPLSSTPTPMSSPVHTPTPTPTPTTTTTSTSTKTPTPYDDTNMVLKVKTFWSILEYCGKAKYFRRICFRNIKSYAKQRKSQKLVMRKIIDRQLLRHAMTRFKTFDDNNTFARLDLFAMTVMYELIVELFDFIFKHKGMVLHLSDKVVQESIIMTNKFCRRVRLVIITQTQVASKSKELLINSYTSLIFSDHVAILDRLLKHLPFLEPIRESIYMMEHMKNCMARMKSIESPANSVNIFGDIEVVERWLKKTELPSFLVSNNYNMLFNNMMLFLKQSL